VIEKWKIGLNLTLHNIALCNTMYLTVIGSIGTKSHERTGARALRTWEQWSDEIDKECRQPSPVMLDFLMLTNIQDFGILYLLDRGDMAMDL